MKIDVSPLKEPIKKYKRWLERDKVDYPYHDKNGTYYVVSYSRFDTRTGCLVLFEDGQVVPRDRAVSIFKQYVVYHTCMLDARQQLAPNINNPIEVFEFAQDLLNDVVTPVAMDHPEAEIMDDVNNILAMAHAMIEGQERLRIIYDELCQIDSDVQKNKGYMTSEVVETVKNLTTEWRVIQYDGLRKSRDAATSFERLRQFSQSCHDHLNGRRKGSAEQIEHLMLNFLDEDNIKTLQRSLQRMEVNTKGSPMNFSAGEHGLHEYSKHVVRKVDDMFQLHVLPILRNE